MNPSGRAGRGEFWWFVLFFVVVGVVLALISFVLYTVFALATLLPYLTLSIRRLHDVGRSGWWLLLSLIRSGGLVLLYWFAQLSQPGPNQFGQQPGAQAMATA